MQGIKSYDSWNVSFEKSLFKKWKRGCWRLESLLTLYFPFVCRLYRNKNHFYCGCFVDVYVLLFSFSPKNLVLVFFRFSSLSRQIFLLFLFSYSLPPSHLSRAQASRSWIFVSLKMLLFKVLRCGFFIQSFFNFFRSRFSVFIFYFRGES